MGNITTIMAKCLICAKHLTAHYLVGTTHLIRHKKSQKKMSSGSTQYLANYTLSVFNNQLFLKLFF